MKKGYLFLLLIAASTTSFAQLLGGSSRLRGLDIFVGDAISNERLFGGSIVTENSQLTDAKSMTSSPIVAIQFWRGPSHEGLYFGTHWGLKASKTNYSGVYTSQDYSVSIPFEGNYATVFFNIGIDMGWNFDDKVLATAGLGWQSNYAISAIWTNSILGSLTVRYMLTDRLYVTGRVDYALTRFSSILSPSWDPMGYNLIDEYYDSQNNRYFSLKELNPGAYNYSMMLGVGFIR